jgi:hypothetical protein
VSSSPFRVELIAGPASLARTVLVGCIANATCRTVKAGDGADFVVKPRDQYGNARGESSGSVRYWLPPADDAKSLASGNDDGTYSFSLTLTTSGRTVLAVSLNAEMLLTTVPTFITVIPADPSPVDSSVRYGSYVCIPERECPPHEEGVNSSPPPNVAGNVTAYHLDVVDAYGNIRDTDSGLVTFQLQGQQAVGFGEFQANATAATTNATGNVTGNVTAAAFGYSLGVTSTLSGEFAASVRLAGVKVGNSGFNVRVVPNVLSLAASTTAVCPSAAAGSQGGGQASAAGMGTCGEVGGSGGMRCSECTNTTCTDCATLTAGVRTFFEVVQRDAFGNKLLALSGITRISVAGAPRTISSVSPGVVMYDVQSFVAGQALVTVAIDGQHIGPSLFAVEVKPAEVSPQKSNVTGCHLGQLCGSFLADANLVREFTLSPKDDFHNALASLEGVSFTWWGTCTS